MHTLHSVINIFWPHIEVHVHLWQTLFYQKNDVIFISVFLIMTSNVIRAFFAWDGSNVWVDSFYYLHEVFDCKKIHIDKIFCFCKNCNRIWLALLYESSLDIKHCAKWRTTLTLSISCWSHWEKLNQTPNFAQNILC